MAKYTCDFGEVNDTGGKLISAADELLQAINDYKVSCENILGAWEGPAKEQFIAVLVEVLGSFEAKAKKGNILGEYVQQIASAIGDEEVALTSLKI